MRRKHLWLVLVFASSVSGEASLLAGAKLQQINCEEKADPVPHEVLTWYAKKALKPTKERKVVNGVETYVLKFKAKQADNFFSRCPSRSRLFRSISQRQKKALGLWKGPVQIILESERHLTTIHVHPDKVIAFHKETIEKELQRALDAKQYRQVLESIAKAERDLEIRLPQGEHMARQARANLMRTDGLQLFRQGEYSNSADMLDSYLEFRSSDVEARRYLGIAHYKLQNYGIAKNNLRQVIRQRRDDSEAAYWLGLVHLTLEDTEAALGYFTQATEEKPVRRPEAYYYLGAAYQKLKQFNSARQAFEAFLHFDNQPEFEVTQTKKALEVIAQLTAAVPDGSSSPAAVVEEPPQPPHSVKPEPPRASNPIPDAGPLPAEEDAPPDPVPPPDAVPPEKPAPKTDTRDTVYPPHLRNLRLTGFRRPPLEFRSLKGQLAIVHFWASWCPPCLGELKEIAEFVREYFPDLKEKGLALVTISNDEREEELERFVDKHLTDAPPDLAVYLDQKARSNDLFELSTVLPQTLILDRDGRVLESFEGKIHWMSADFLDKIRGYLEGSGN